MPFSFKQWYEANGDRLNKSRRDRYEYDEAYREQVLERNRQSRKKRRSDVLKERGEEKGAILVKVSARPWKSVDMDIEVDGQVVSTKMLTIGAVAKAVGRSVQAVRLWEKQGLLPKTPHSNPKGDRLYTAVMVEEIVQTLEKLGKLDSRKVKARYAPRGVLCDLQLSNGSNTTERLFRIGVLAKAVNRTVITVEQLEQKGYIPKTSFRASKTQYRLYTIAMIDAVKAVFDSHNNDIRGPEQWQSVHDSILDLWKKQGVVGAAFTMKKKERTSKNVRG